MWLNIRKSSTGGDKWTVDDWVDWDSDQWGLIASFMAPALIGLVVGLMLVPGISHATLLSGLGCGLGCGVAGLVFRTPALAVIWTLVGFAEMVLFVMWFTGILNYLRHTL